MKTLLITTIVLVLVLFTYTCVADVCNCWKWYEFGGCKPWNCTPDGDPNDPDTTWRVGWNILLKKCEYVDDDSKSCSETTSSGNCAGGNVYWDEDCTDYKTRFVVTYSSSNWPTGASDSCF